MIISRTIKKDVHRYNAVDLSDEIQEDYGWKLVHSEVFRQPQRAMLLSIAIGSGAQLNAMIGVSLFFALLGFLSPSNRGSLSTVMIVCWTLFGGECRSFPLQTGPDANPVVAGYVSTRLYASLGGQSWKKNMFGTAVLFPTILFATLNLLNFFLIGAGSSGAVPFGTFLSIILLWIGVAVPLTVGGSLLGIKRGAIPHPVRVNTIPRRELDVRDHIHQLNIL